MNIHDCHKPACIVTWNIHTHCDSFRIQNYKIFNIEQAIGCYNAPNQTYKQCKEK